MLKDRPVAVKLHFHSDIFARLWRSVGSNVPKVYSDDPLYDATIIAAVSCRDIFREASSREAITQPPIASHSRKRRNLSKLPWQVHAEPGQYRRWLGERRSTGAMLNQHLRPTNLPTRENFEGAGPGFHDHVIHAFPQTLRMRLVPSERPTKFPGSNFSRQPALSAPLISA